MQTETIKVKPWGQGQGEYVEINASDYDPKIHTLYEPKPASQPKPATKRG